LKIKKGGIKMLTNEQWANRIDGNMKPVVHLTKDDTYVIWNNIGVSGKRPRTSNNW